MHYLTADDVDWQEKAQNLAEKGQPFDIHDLSPADAAFVIELARRFCSPEHFKLENGRAELRPKG